MIHNYNDLFSFGTNQPPGIVSRTAQKIGLSSSHLMEALSTRILRWTRGSASAVQFSEPLPGPPASVPPLAGTVFPRLPTRASSFPGLDSVINDSGSWSVDALPRNFELRGTAHWCRCVSIWIGKSFSGAPRIRFLKIAVMPESAGCLNFLRGWRPLNKKGEVAVSVAVQQPLRHYGGGEVVSKLACSAAYN